jgi:bifunctional DNA-binding transcriptional regulator/antitoxin component of YhaV-PrlF toxin-antitoxin module
MQTQEKYDIKTVLHNRCVVIPTEQLVRAGIAKGDYVTVRAEGDEIRIKKVRLCPYSEGMETCDI